MSQFFAAECHNRALFSPKTIDLIHEQMVCQHKGAHRRMLLLLLTVQDVIFFLKLSKYVKQYASLKHKLNLI